MKKRKNAKGFTLIELIVVMAIFSILMVAVMQIIDPLSRMMKKASIQEANSAAVDNMKRYFEGSLRYAECVETFEGGLVDDAGRNYTDYSTSELAHLGAADKEEAAVVNFIFNHYTDKTNPGTEDQFEGIVRMLKIDNVAGGVVTEYEWDFTAGYSYQQYDINGNKLQVQAVKADGSPAFEPDGVTPLYIDDLGKVLPKIENRQEFNDVINPVYYENYSFFFEPGYNEMQTIFDSTVVNNLFNTADDDASDYYASVQPVLAPNGNRYGSFNPDMFSLSVITYKKDAPRADYPDDPNTTENEEAPAFKSPFALSNINMSLVNIRSSFSSNRASDNWGPVRYSGWPKINGVLSTDRYEPLDDMVDLDGDGFWDYEKIGINQASKIDSRFFRHSPAATDDGCIYFIYTLPEAR